MQSFDKYGLNEKLLLSIKELGFVTPTSIQDKVIPHILSSKSDIIATAQTGTGKTAAFGLPIINLTDNHNKNIECVIICPTRELCLQITKDLSIYSEHMSYYKIIPIYGGSKIETQIKGIRKNPKIIVCTPGRLNDLIQRRKLNLSVVKYFVLDEADEMLSMGFKAEIDKVLNEIPLDRKIYLFSATLSPKVKKITQTYMKKPLMISASPVNQGADTVKHIYYMSEKNKRYDIIKNIIDINKDIYTIIFCRTRRETKDISRKLIDDRYNAKVLNGDLSQNERDNVMNLFRSKKINILVATDVASRGIDVNNLTHIINYNLPDDAEVYIHRSGRTGRAGNEGLSIVFISRSEYKRLDEIKRLSKISFNKSEVPSQTEVFKSKISLFTNKIINTSIPSEKERVIFEDFYSQLSKFTKEEIIGKILNLNIRATKLSKNSPSVKTDYPKKQTRKSDNNVMSKLSINIGRSNKLTPEMLIRLINKTIRSRDTEIGKINISKNYATFEIESKVKDMVISKMQHIRHDRKRILVSSYDEGTIDLPRNKNHKNKRRRNYNY
jgi:ATP-dependent RNA helicase DeaD